MMKKYFLFSLLLITGMTFAETGVIEGKVFTQDGNPAEFVNIILVGTSKGATVQADGSYRIPEVKAGNYTLKASFVGLDTQSKQVQVTSKGTAKADFTLSENSKELKEVVVTSNPARYVADYPSISLRLKTPVLQLPQNIQIITKQVIEDQQIFDMLEGVTRNVSGTQRMEHWDNYALIYMRGSQIAAFRNGMNVTMSWSPQPEDMSMVERIEFVKGPAGFMLANGEPSGFYNVVTKKPTGINKGEIGMTAGSFNTFRGTFDLDGKLDKNGKLLYRLNMLAQSKGSHRNYEFSDKIAIAPVIKYQLNDKTSLTTEYTYQRNKMSTIGTNYSYSKKGYGDLPADFTTAEDNMPPTLLTESSVFVTMVHNLDENWKFTGQVAYINSLQEGQSLWPTGFEVNDSSLLRGISIWDYEGESKVGQFFLNGDLKTGNITHRILTGLDMGIKSFYHDWAQTAALKSLNIYNPVYGQIAASEYPVFDRELPLRQRGVHYQQSYFGYYLQDEISLLRDRLRLTIAARYTTAASFDPYSGAIESSKLTPRFGASFSFDKNTSAYGVYDQAFVPQAGADFNGNSFDPVTGNNIEFGVKREWLGGNWVSNLSVYHITKKNILTSDPNHQYFSIQLGQSVTKGIEFDLRGQITDNLNVTANYAYTDGKVTKDTDPARVNVAIPGISTHIANGWLTYKFDGWFKGIGLSLGTQYQGDRTSWYVFDGTRQDLPDYFRLDGAISYQLNKFSIALNINNLTNNYLYSGAYYNWGGFYYWQIEPLMNARFNITYKF
ncbi:MAG: TonB-dependent receptor [Paludibacter sp.]|nr:TonB-dependent receptor [Paludibacter sp.]